MQAHSATQHLGKHRATEAADHLPAYAADRRGEGDGPLSTAHAEPDDLRAFAAVIDTLAQRADSAI
jgi:hypothetical protein